MRILILSSDPNNIINNGFINNQSSIYAFFFNKWLKKYSDCEIENKNLRLSIDEIKNLNEYDFCILSINRGALVIGDTKFYELRKKIKYHIITICGSNSIIDKEDLLLFTMGKNKNKTLRLFWGADFDLLKPTKDKIINILIDHQYYGKNKTSIIHKKDKTTQIIKSVIEYKKLNNIIVKHIASGCVHDVTSDYSIAEYKQKDAIDFRKIYEYYNNAHIYVVTHPECFGLSVIECAAAGALIVTPTGYINKNILKYIYHVVIDDCENIDWGSIITKININKSIEMAKKFSYQVAMDKLHEYMINIYNSSAHNGNTNTLIQ